jgi:hypothetical protein
MNRALLVVCASLGAAVVPAACSSEGPAATQPGSNRGGAASDARSPDASDLDDGRSTSTDPNANGDASANGDGNANAIDGGGVRCVPPSVVPLGRGLAFTRTQPIFVSGLVVGLAPPSVAEVNDYFDAFGANAVHTWASGLPSSIAGFRAANRPDFRYVSWVQADGTSVEGGQLLGGVGAASAGRIGFQIGDEPNDDGELDTMLHSASTIRAADPGALVILNFADRDNAEALLTKATANPDVDVLSIDQYSYKDDVYGLLERVRSHGVAAGKPYWRYADSFAYPSGDVSPTESDMRWDAMVGLLYGFTGLTWFVYQIDPSPDLAPELFVANGSFSAAKTPRFAIASAVNHEVRNLGAALTQLTSTGVRYVAGTSLLQPKDTTPWSKGAGANPYLASIATGGGFHDLHVGFFEDPCHEPYVMLMNPAHTKGKFPLSSEAPVTATLGFDFSASADPTLDETAVEVLDPKTGAITRRALAPKGAHAASLDVTLGPAEAILLKPANGRAFAGR